MFSNKSYYIWFGMKQKLARVGTNQARQWKEKRLFGNKNILVFFFLVCEFDRILINTIVDTRPVESRWRTTQGSFVLVDEQLKVKHCWNGCGNWNLSSSSFSFPEDAVKAAEANPIARNTELENAFYWNYLTSGRLFVWS